MDAAITGRQVGGSTGRRFDLASHGEQCTKKNELKPWLVQRWCIGNITGDYIWHMEDILSLYEEPYDRLWPVICFDERPCQLIGDVLAPMPMQPRRSKRQDYEYERHGTCCVLLAVEPLQGWRYIQVRERRTAIDYASFMKELVETYYPSVEVIRLVQDNLNTHTPGSFYYAFTPSEGFALAQKFEWHYTPLKASWLNMAEIELSALAQQCLDRRIGDMEMVKKEVTIWTCKRNQARKTVRWKFTKSDARRKLHGKYPTMQN
jgi:DDE superfamily endonuclease